MLETNFSYFLNNNLIIDKFLSYKIWNIADYDFICYTYYRNNISVDTCKCPNNNEKRRIIDAKINFKYFIQK